MNASDAGTVRLGDLTVPRMGYGAMRLPGPGVWGPPADRNEALGVLRGAVSLGVRVIDTAWYYGMDIANELIAAALQPYPADLVLVTKLGAARRDDGSWYTQVDAQRLRQGCERDLRVLGLDSIPLTHLRWNSADSSPGVSFDEALGTMLDLQREGKIQRLGLSNVTIEQLDIALHSTPIASVSNLYGITARGDQAMLERCTQAGIAYLPFFPLAAGRMEPGNVLAAVASRLNASAAQVSLAWLLARSPVMLPIPGTGSVAHLKENVAAAGLTLSPDDLAQLECATGHAATSI